MNPTQFPALKLLAGLALGVGGQFWLADVLPESTWLFVSCGFVLLAALCLVFKQFVFKQFALIQSLTALCYWSAALCAGVLIGWNARQTTLLEPQHLQSRFVPEMKAVVKGEIVKILRRDSVSVRCIVQGIVDAKALPPVESRIVLTIRTSPQSEKIFASGMSIYAPATVRFPKKPILPTDFDEQLYYASLDVQWLGRTDAAKVGIQDQQTTLQSIAESCAEDIQCRLIALFPPETAGFAVALLTGNRILLDANTQREYALAGTAHILAVSGLHIGLVAVIVLVPLGFVRNKWVKFLIFTITMAAFVLVTGGAPSAVRSGVMAVFMLLARYTQRKVVLLNIVAFTVVVMLAVDASLLYSVSFQMSAAALFGISLFYKPLYDLFVWMLKAERSQTRAFVANSLALTLASSSIVSLLVAWYFGVFSVISPLANLVVVPLSSGAMIYTLASVVVSYIPVIGTSLGGLFASAAHGFLWLMNTVNAAATQVEYSAIQGSMAFLLACLVSTVTLYCAFATTARKLVFRAIVSCVFAVTAFIVFRPVDSPNTHSAVTIIPRQQFVAALVPSGTHRTMIVCQDRRNDLFPLGDTDFERFVERYSQESRDTLLLCTTGPASLYAASRINATTPATLLATSLQYKQRRQFEALANLDARNIRLVNAESVFKRDSIVMLGSGTKQREWNIWRNELVVNGSRIVLPKAVSMLVLP